jgi:hypothetical protein
MTTLLKEMMIAQLSSQIERTLTEFKRVSELLGFCFEIKYLKKSKKYQKHLNHLFFWLRGHSQTTFTRFGFF